MQTRADKTRTNGRRDFLKQSSLATAGALLGATAMHVPHVHAAATDMVKIALVGCGGRGTGAAQQAASADPNVKLWAVADVFPDRSSGVVRRLSDDFKGREPNQAHKIDVTPERMFDGFDAYKKAMDTLDPGDVVVLGTPPAFRPLHFAYAVEKGLNIFAEKPVACDIPGLKSLQESNKIAMAKGLKVGVGLNNRHSFRTEETVKAIHDGKLGELYAFLVYRCQPGVHTLPPRGDQTPLQFQLRRIFNFNWLTGGFIVDALIHNLDICCWVNMQTPVAAFGMGGRLFRRAQDDMIDNATVEYAFADGKKMHMYACTTQNTRSIFQAAVHGSKGGAILGESVRDPRFLEDWSTFKDGKNQKVFWTPQAGGNDSYQTEHDRLFKAIRDGVEWNEMGYGIDATFTAIMGRMATETGKMVTAEEAWSSAFEYAPNIDKLTLDGDSPFMPDANGDYRIAVPGKATINDPYAS